MPWRTMNLCMRPRNMRPHHHSPVGRCQGNLRSQDEHVLRTQCYYARCDHYTATRIEIWGKPYLDSSDIGNVNVRDLLRFTSKTGRLSTCYYPGITGVCLGKAFGPARGLCLRGLRSPAPLRYETIHCYYDDFYLIT